ncbi:hypothetical protein B0H12DRAFT_1075409 [Mycena haematopus]|nr:hypothetical protein B0H12DRAFT_1075409 [Mycena haematopus]
MSSWTSLPSLPSDFVRYLSQSQRRSSFPKTAVVDTPPCQTREPSGWRGEVYTLRSRRYMDTAFPPSSRPHVVPPTALSIRRGRWEQARKSPPDIHVLMIASAAAASRCRWNRRYHQHVAWALLFRLRPTTTTTTVPMSFQYIDDVAEEAPDDEETECESEEDDEGSHEAAARALDRADIDFEPFDRVVEQFAATGMIPPLSSNHGARSSRSRSPVARSKTVDRMSSPDDTMADDTWTSEKSSRSRPRSTSPPPAKRQRTEPETPSLKTRLKKRVLSFIDNEAQDAEEDSEEGDNVDSEDSEEEFLDDTESVSPTDPSHRDPPPRLQTAEEQAREYEAIAQRFVDKARCLVPAPAPREAIPLLGDRFDPHRYPSIPPTAADILDSPLYAYSVPPKSEIRLIRYLYHIEGVNSVFTRSIGSGVVYVEATDITQVSKGMRLYSGVWRMHNKPLKIDTLDSWFRIVLPPPVDHVGHWRRLDKRRGTLLVGDLVFVYDDSYALGVPRVRYLQDRPSLSGVKSLPPPPALFDPSKFVRQCPDIPLQKRNSLYITKKFTIRGDGLETIYWGGNVTFFTTAATTPTPAELAPFISANRTVVQSKRPVCPDMRCRPYLGTTCALQEGDEVVVVAGDDEGTVGQIARILEKQRIRANGDQHLERYVAVHKGEVDGRFEITRKNIESEVTIIVPIHDLRLQCLAAVRLIILGDRVKITGRHPSRGISGRVLDVGHSDMITMQPSDSHSPLYIHLRYLQRDFRLGDIVNIADGPHAGHSGFISGLRIGGYVDFFPCELERMKSAVNTKLTYQQVKDDITFPVRTADLQFLLIDHWSPVKQEHQSFDNLQSRWERDLMNTGRGYLNMQVRLAYKHPDKGLFGTVIGFNRTSPQAAPPRHRGFFERSFFDDVQLTIQIDHGHRQVTATLDQVMHKYSRLPLPQARLFMSMAPDPVDTPLAPTIAPPVPVWGDEGKEAVAPDIGEYTGVWLTRPEFVGKRIDIVIVGVHRTKFPTLVNRRGTQHEGATGYLEPFHEPPAPSSFRKKGIKVRVHPMMHSAIIPADALLPERQTPSDECISVEKSRVIIIGPDVRGSWRRAGQYAETVPGGSDIPAVVKVRFQRAAGEVENPAGFYHLTCLCRALNTELICGSWTIPRTDFDVEVS